MPPKPSYPWSWWPFRSRKVGIPREEEWEVVARKNETGSGRECVLWVAALRVSFSLSKAIFFSNFLSRSVCRGSPSLKRQNCTVQQAVSSMAVCVVPVRICSVVCTIPKTEGVSEACSALSQALRVGAELLYSSRELPEAGFCYHFGVSLWFCWPLFSWTLLFVRPRFRIFNNLETSRQSKYSCRTSSKIHFSFSSLSRQDNSFRDFD